MNVGVDEMGLMGGGWVGVGGVMGQGRCSRGGQL